MQALYYPNQAADLIEFLIQTIGFKVQELQEALSNIPSERLPASFLKQFNPLNR